MGPRLPAPSQLDPFISSCTRTLPRFCAPRADAVYRLAGRPPRLPPLQPAATPGRRAGDAVVRELVVPVGDDEVARRARRALDEEREGARVARGRGGGPV